MSKKKGLTFSDMHLMRERGDFKGLKANMIRLISAYDVVFYNGDIFELFYGKYLAKEHISLEHAQNKAAKAALRKMEKLILATPNTEHIYILGNHEDVEAFKIGLDKLAAKYPNFSWHPELIRYQDMFFLHGDLPMGGNPEQREWYPFNNLWAAKIYDFISNSYEMLFLNILDHTINRETEVCRKTLEYIRLHHSQELDGARHIFIGHTHKPFTLEYEGYIFYNTGTLVMDERDYPIELEIDMETGITATKVLPSHLLRHGMREESFAWARLL